MQKEKIVCTVYGEGALTDWACQEWVVKFHSGDCWLDDIQPSDRPVEVDGDQTELLTENNWHYTTREITDILKISKSIKLLMKMKNVSLFDGKKNIGTFWPTQ